MLFDLQEKIITSAAEKVLAGFQWPGNIRELQNIIERLVLTTGGKSIDVDDLPKFIIEGSETADTIPRHGSLQNQLAMTEKHILTKAAKQCHSTRDIARLLQTSQPTIVRKLNKYHIKVR